MDAPPLRYYQVPDTLGALGRLGRFRRRQVDPRVVAITGTNGKTTTKEMSRAILATRYNTHATTGNLNNLVGAPLTLVDAPARMRRRWWWRSGPTRRARSRGWPRWWSRTSAIVTGRRGRPPGGFGTLEGVLREKTTLLSRIRPGGLALVADEPAALPERARSLARRVRWQGGPTGPIAD
jgi:UDP-N-acetylmuramyl pentapeptide synthase